MYKETFGGGQVPGRDVADTVNGREVANTVKNLADRLGIKYNSTVEQMTTLGDGMYEVINLSRNGSRTSVIVDLNKGYDTMSGLVTSGNGDNNGFQDLRQGLQGLDNDRRTNGRYNRQETDITSRLPPKVNSAYEKKPVQRLRQPVQSSVTYSGEDVLRNIETYAKDQGCDVRISRGYAGSPKDSNMYTEVSIIDPDKKGILKSGVFATALIWNSQSYDCLGGHIKPRGENPKYAQLETTLKKMDNQTLSASQAYDSRENKVIDLLNNTAMTGQGGNLEKTLYK